MEKERKKDEEELTEVSLKVTVCSGFKPSNSSTFKNRKVGKENVWS